MPLSIVASFMSTNNTEDGVPVDVGAARPMVLDPDIDFWAFGIILLEHRCEAYCQSRFRVIDLGGPYSSVICHANPVPDLSHDRMITSSCKQQDY